jgi:hypothetical protein
MADYVQLTILSREAFLALLDRTLRAVTLFLTERIANPHY